MTKLLDQAIEKVRTLPEAEQDEAAAAIFAFLTRAEPDDFAIDESARRAIDEGLAQAQRGEFVSDAEIDALWKRHAV